MRQETWWIEREIEVLSQKVRSYQDLSIKAISIAHKFTIFVLIRYIDLWR